MNKAELVAALEGRLGSKKVATDALEAIVDTIQRTVARGEKVAISGFGSFEKAIRGPRTGRNPRTGESVKIKKTSVPRFKPGTAFKGYVADPKSVPKAAVAAAAKTVSRAAGAARTAAKAPAKAAAKAPARTAAKAPARTAAKAPARTAAKSAVRTAAKAPARTAAKAPAKAAAKAPAKTAAKAPARTAAKRTPAKKA